MRHIPLAALLVLAACSDAGQARVERATAALCRLDGVAQPVAMNLVNGVVTVAPTTATKGVALAMALDTVAVHPSVVAACQARGGVVVKVVE